MGFIPKEHTEGQIRINRNKPNYFAYWTIAVVIGIILAVLLKSFFIKGYYVTADNMSTNLKPGDLVVVHKLNIDQITKREDMLCFRYPAEPSQYRFGRAVARGLDIVEIIDKQLYVNGRMVDPPVRAHFTDSEVEDDPFSLRDNFGPFDVPEDHYFILGDNRDNAIDSRYYGALPYDDVLGKPVFVYFGWEPDPRAPKVRELMDIPSVIIYNISHFFERIKLDRIGKTVQ